MLPLGNVDQRQDIEGLGHVRVVRPKRGLEQGQRTASQRLGLRVAALGAVEPSHVVEGSADVGVFVSQRLFGDRQGADIGRLGLGVALLRLVEQGQVVEQRRRDRVVGTELRLA